MLTLFGGSAFPSGVERQDSIDSLEYVYSSNDEDELSQYELSDDESDDESDKKMSVQDQLKLIRLAEEKNYLKKQDEEKNIELEFKIIEDEKRENMKTILID